MSESRISRGDNYWVYDDEDLPHLIPAGFVTPEEFVAAVIVHATDQGEYGESIERTVRRRMAAFVRPKQSVTFRWAVAWTMPAMELPAEAVVFEYINPRAHEFQWTTGTEPSIEMVQSAIVVYENSSDPGYGVSRLLDLQRMLTQVVSQISESVQRVSCQFIPSLNAPPRDSWIAAPAHSRIAWIDTSVDLFRAGKKEESLDVIFDNLDEMLLGLKFAECDALLQEIPIGELSNAQLLTVLTATVAAKESLPRRNIFVDRVKSVLNKRRADAPRLLAGLE
jgi:hypothetical protein